jgi:hypothetical protein
MITFPRLKSIVLLPLVAVALMLVSVPPAAEASTVTGDQIVRSARAQLGVPYSFGGNGPRTLDCSGLVRLALAEHGITNVPRASIDQHRWARSITRSQLRPGDLVFQSWGPRNGPNGTDHVAIYLGRGRVLDASSSRGRVIERSLTERVVTGYGRIPGVSHTSSGPTSTSSSTSRSGWAGGTTRAEAARIVADTLDLRNRRNPFGVTTEGGAVGAVYLAGIGLPYSDGTWRPHASITRGQLAAWLARADPTRAEAARVVADVMGLKHRSNPFGVTTQGGAVGAVYHAGIGLPYSNRTWRPHASVTRGQLDAWMRRAG